MILDYQSNQQVAVRQVASDLFECKGLLEDSLFGAEVTLEIKIPSLEITSAKYSVNRSFLPVPDELPENFKKLRGVRTGQGLTRIVKGLVGGPEGSDRLAGLVMDTAEGIILAFTKGPLKAATKDSGIENPNESGRRLNPRVMGPEHIKMMSEQNPRMKDSCIAFIEPEGGADA